MVTVPSAADRATPLADHGGSFRAVPPEIDVDTQMVAVVPHGENETCSFPVEDPGIVAGPEGWGRTGGLRRAAGAVR